MKYPNNLEGGGYPELHRSFQCIAGPKGPAADPKGPHESEASDEPEREEPVPEATHWTCKMPMTRQKFQ